MAQTFTDQNCAVSDCDVCSEDRLLFTGYVVNCLLIHDTLWRTHDSTPDICIDGYASDLDLLELNHFGRIPSTGQIIHG